MRSLVLVACLLAATPAAAQDQMLGEAHAVGGAPVELVVRWTGRDGRPHGVVEVRAGGQTRAVHEGTPAYAWAAGGEHGLLVAMVGASASVEVAYVPIVDGHPGAPRRHSVHRLAGPDRAPIGAAVAARPDGFAVFWQEASTSNPSAIYETYGIRFDAEGTVIGDTQRVQAPWPIADVAWIPASNQYYFLLFYGGSDPNGTRLCGVHVDPARLANVEHPWWSSRPGAIDEARLAVRGGRVVAVYREAGHLHEIDVTQGSWGRDPDAGATRDRGAIAATEAYGVEGTDEGVTIRRVALGP
ncbi:MAG: hypothetical protein R3B82_21875 [Sandaracinaceae bacterium]